MPITPRGLGLSAALLYAAGLPGASAEIVRLKNGNTLEGEVVSTTDAEIVLEIPGLGRMAFSRGDVVSVEASLEKRYEYSDPDEQPTAGAKKDPGLEAQYKRRQHAGNAQRAFSRASRAEPSTSSNDEYAISSLKNAISLYERAVREAQRALEVDRRYAPDVQETLEMKQVIQEARERAAALSERLRSAERQLEAREKAEQQKDKGLEFKELGTSEERSFY